MNLNITEIYNNHTKYSQRYPVINICWNPSEFFYIVVSYLIVLQWLSSLKCHPEALIEVIVSMFQVPIQNKNRTIICITSKGCLLPSKKTEFSRVLNYIKISWRMIVSGLKVDYTKSSNEIEQRNSLFEKFLLWTIRKE